MIQFLPRFNQVDTHLCSEIEQQLSIPTLVAQMLVSSGYDTTSKAYDFLHPSFGQLLPSSDFEQMEDALDCLYATQTMDELICVYGDYDVDGVCATTILVDYLCKNEFRAMGYIPTRHGEGYGLNNEAIDALASQGVATIITVDCGITALEQIAYAQELGMEVIVTDHHQCLNTVPECAAIINPQASTYSNKALCGAGVAFKIVGAMGGEGALKEYIDIAAIATVADIVDLKGENRAIVALGLEKLRKNTRIGVQELIKVAGYEQSQLTEQDIAFGLAPRINAAGRMNTAQIVLDLFLTEDEKEAEKLAKKLDEANTERKKQENEIFVSAVEKIEAGEVNLLHDGAILLTDSTWNAGIIGIVSSRLVKRYYKPVILFTQEENQDSWVGSGRSIEGIHLFQALQKCEPYFERYGGHSMAAGLSISKEKFEAFKEDFLKQLARDVAPDVYVPRAFYDFEITPAQATLALCDSFGQMAPFGVGNPKPRFLFSQVVPENMRTMGSDFQHLKCKVGDVELVAFQQGSMLRKLQDTKVTFLVSLEKNVWKGQTRLQALVDEMRVDMPTDTVQYVQNRYWEFVDAYCQNILMGTMTAKTSITADVCDEIKTALLAKPQGSLVICDAPETAEVLLKFIIDEGLQQHVVLELGVVKDIRCYNTILLAPTTDALHNVLYDERFCLSSKDDFHQMDCTREALIPIYQAIRALALKQRDFLNLSTYLGDVAKMCRMSYAQIILALHVFTELGFLECSRGAKFTVKAVTSPAKKDLLESLCFQAFQK